MARYTPEQRQELVQAFKKSGMMQRAFAEQHGVNFHTLQYWLHRSPNREKVHFVEVRDAGGSTHKEQARVRLKLGAKVELEMAELPPAEYLAQLLEVLG